jgi:hypothetical protein
MIGGGLAPGKPFLPRPARRSWSDAPSPAASERRSLRCGRSRPAPLALEAVVQRRELLAPHRPERGLPLRRDGRPTPNRGPGATSNGWDGEAHFAVARKGSHQADCLPSLAMAAICTRICAPRAGARITRRRLLPDGSAV